MPRSTRRPRERLEGPEAQMQKLLDALANPTRPKRRRKATRKKTRAKAAASRRRTTAARKPTRKCADTTRRTTTTTKRRTCTTKRNPRTASKWWRFTLYGDRGARLGRAVGKGSKLEAAKEGSKLARRHGVRRVVMEGPYASMEKAF